MSGFSTVDGFVEISESLAKMIKYMANEPSVGLYYIQQHTQKAVPNLINLRHKVVAKSHETILQTEDLEDSITMVKSMKEYGFPIAEEMIKDINKSLVIMSTKQSDRNSRLRRTSSGEAAADIQPDGGSTSYFSSIFKTAKQKKSNINRPQVVRSKSIQEQVSSSFLNETAAVQSTTGTSTTPVTEADGLHLPRPVAEETEERQDNINQPIRDSSSTLEIYDEFKADKEAKLEKWLAEMEN